MNNRYSSLLCTNLQKMQSRYLFNFLTYLFLAGLFLSDSASSIAHSRKNIPKNRGEIYQTLTKRTVNTAPPSLWTLIAP